LSAVRHALAAVSARGRGLPTTRTVTVNYAQGTYATPNTGYFAGGSPGPGNSSNVQRIDYSNDTATASERGNLVEINIYGNGLANKTHGYVCGGEGTSPSSISKVQRITFLNDTAVSVFKGNLSQTISAMDATGTEHFGYIAAPGPDVDRIDYSNDTATALLKAPLPQIGFDIAAAGNQNFGYFAGGYNQITTVNRLDYANDTTQVPARGPLSGTGGRYMAGAGNGNFGYFASGSMPSYLSSVDRVDYSNDTVAATPKGPLTDATGLYAATGSHNFGYFAFPSSITTLDRIDYANDTATASVRGQLVVGRSQNCGFSSREYDMTIIGPSVVSNAAAMAVNPPTNFGYFAGGTTGAPQLSTVQRIDYSNDSASLSTRGQLPAEREFVTGTSSSFFGYVGGGGPSSNSKTEIFRIDYSNDTVSAEPRGQLTIGRPYSDATGNKDFGYFVAGVNPASSPSNQSIVDRIDYSNDGATALVRGPLTVGRMGVAAVGNQNFGYVAGQSIPMISNIDRIDYSNDTATATPKGTLTAARGYMSATGNANFGYFGAGQVFVPNTFTELTLVDRIDYSNDTATASPKGPLNQTRVMPAATGNKDFGYFAGGGPSNLRSSVDRVDYSNDTATAVAKPPLATGNYGFAGFSAAGNANPQ